MIIDFHHLPAGIDMNKQHRYGQMHRRAKAIHNIVKEMMMERGDIPEDPYSRVELHTVFHYPDLGNDDMENNRAALKPYLDGLVRCGVLEDDNKKVVYREIMDWDVNREVPGFTLYITPWGEICPACRIYPLPPGVYSPELLHQVGH